MLKPHKKMRRTGKGTSDAVDKATSTSNGLSHQKEMLSDCVRMNAYYNSIFKNKHHFIGKTVLDVGTGSGILAIWSAQAGAKKVYAVEATKMAEHARQLVKANNLQDVVEVIEGSIEDITLPEKVDVIISEWMGCFLPLESMFDSFICARDRWLKPTGVMYPSHARMGLSPIMSALPDFNMWDYEECMDDWRGFVKETINNYGVDMSVLTEPFSEEREKYYFQNSQRIKSIPEQVIGTAAILKEIDCLTATVQDILEIEASVSSTITKENMKLCVFGGWLGVHFNGRKENPAECEVELTTAPKVDLLCGRQQAFTYSSPNSKHFHIKPASVDDDTQWGRHQVFTLHHPVMVNEKDEVLLTFSMSRSEENHRLMNVDLGYQIKLSSGKMLSPVKCQFYIE